MRDEGSVAVEEGDSRQDIAKAVDAMTREAIFSDPVMDSSRFSDGYVLYTVQFLDGEVCITGALWTIEQETLPCEVQLSVDRSITQLHGYDLRIGSTPMSEVDIMGQRYRGSGQWLIEYAQWD